MTRRYLLPLACLLTFSSAFAYSRGTMQFLTFVSSAQLNGTAGTLMSSSLTDPLTCMTNPGALGRMAQYSRVSGEFNTERTQWLPGFDLLDIHYSARALSFGSDAGQLFDKQPSNFFLGLGYNEAYLDLGETTRRGPNNEPLGTFHSWERVQGLTFAGSYVRPIHLSFGLTMKHAVSELGQSEAKAFANDFGVLASLPKAWRRSSALQPFLSPTIGYALTNVGGEVRYTGSTRGDPLPRTATVSLSLAGGLNMPDARGDWHILAMEYAVQGQDELITVDNSHGDYHYQWFTGDINVFSDLLLGQANDRIIKRRGWEVGFLDMFFVRHGSYEDVGDDWHYKTDGNGVRLHGLLRLIERLSPELKAEHVWSFVIAHLDFAYNESRWQQNRSNYFYSAIDNTSFRQLSLYFR